MLNIVIPGVEYFDEKQNCFVEVKTTKLQLEHSLFSIEKWEAKWHKPFYNWSEEKTEEERIDYIRCMTITQNVDPKIYHLIPNQVKKQIEEYMNDPMTATWFRKEEGKPRNREVITSEIIYWWMFAQGIPLECQKWHINRLLTQIRVCSEKNKESSDPKSGKRKRMSRKSLADRKSLNQSRKSELNSRG